MLQYGDAALHETAYRGRAEMIKLLIDFHAVVDIPNKVW